LPNQKKAGVPNQTKNKEMPNQHSISIIRMGMRTMNNSSKPTLMLWWKNLGCKE